MNESIKKISNKHLLDELTFRLKSGEIDLKHTQGCLADDEPDQAYFDYHYFKTREGYVVELSKLKKETKNYGLEEITK